MTLETLLKYVDESTEIEVQYNCAILFTGSCYDLKKYKLVDKKNLKIMKKGIYTARVYVNELSEKQTRLCVEVK